MQQMIRLVAEGPATEQLMEEVKQVATQSDAEGAVVQVELGDLCNKITVPTEWLEGESQSLCWGPIGMGSLGLALGLKTQFLM